MTEPPTNEIVLTRADLDSALWQKLKRYYERQLAILRGNNDASLPQDDTQRLRGRIAECKAFLALDRKPTP